VALCGTHQVRDSVAAVTTMSLEPVAQLYDDQVTLVELAVLSLAEAMPSD